MKRIKLEKKSFLKAVIALAVALAFVMPGAAAFANVGTIGVTSNSENTDTINNIVEDGEGPIDKREVTSDTSDVVEDAVLGSRGNIIYVGSGPDNDSATIQGGINLANPGDTVYVYNGTYTESNILVTTSLLNLIGESKEGVIVDSNPNEWYSFKFVQVSNTNISNFTIKNAMVAGICIECQGTDSEHISITNCIIHDTTYHGIATQGGTGVRTKNSIIKNCEIYNAGWNGITLGNFWGDNTISECYIHDNNNYGIYLIGNVFGNYIYHNNLIGNTQNAYPDTGGPGAIWDNGYPSGGNYWDDYTGIDDDGDGIGDTPYILDGDEQDRYPLMDPWGIGPEITDVTATPELQSVGGNVNITCTAEDVHNGVKQAIVYITDPTGSQQGFEMTGINVDYLGNGEYYYNTTHSTIGMYNYFIRAENRRDCGNESDTYEFKMKSGINDTVPPVTNCTLMGTVGENDWYVSDVKVTLTVTDPHPSSGINYTMYKLDETNWTEYGSITVTTDETHTVKYYSVDMAGNVESNKSVSFKIDQTAPETSCELDPPEPDGENDWYVSNVEVKLTATDDTSGVNYTMYNLDGTGWTECGSITVTTDETHTVKYNSTDNASNTESTKSVDFEIDKTDPVTTHSLSGTMGNNGWYTSNVVVTLTASDVTSEINYTMYKLDENNWTEYGSITVITDGTHTVKYYSVDIAGNVESTKSVDFEIDKTDPVTTHSLSGTMGNNGWYTSNVVVTLTASDVTSEINYTMYKLDGTNWTEYGSITVNTDGTHTVEYYSVDMAGNTESTKSVDFKIDQTTAPETSCELDPPEPDGENDWYVSDVEVKLTATDDTSGMNYTMYNLDGTGWIGYTVSIMVNTDGSHTVEYYSVDIAGNVESTKSVDFEIDQTAPETNCEPNPSEPDEGNDWYISPVTVTLEATDGGSGVEFTYYKLDDNGEYEEYDGPITVSEDGEYKLWYYSVDYAGNKEDTKSVSFKIDQTPPTIDLTWNKDDSKLVADVSDETSGVAKVEFSVNGEYVGTATEYPYEWIVSNPKKGDKGQATVYDYAGNENISEEIDAVSQSQSQSSSSTSETVDSKLEDTSNADSITDAKSNEITVEPELDVGRIFLKNSSPLSFFKRALIKK